MSIEIASRQGSVFNPEEISVLQQVFNEACYVLCADTDSEQARNIALNILSVYKSGIREKDALLETILLSRPTSGAANRTSKKLQTS